MNNQPIKVLPAADIAATLPGLRRVKPTGLLEKETGLAALKQAFIMLRPDIQWKNPVMFVVEVGAFLTLLYLIQAALGKQVSEVPISYFIWVVV